MLCKTNFELYFLCEDDIGLILCTLHVYFMNFRSKMLQRFRPFVRTNNLLRMHRTEVLHVENCAKCARTLFKSSFSPGPIGYSKIGKKKFEIEKSQVEVDDGDVFGDIQKDVTEKIASDFMFEEVYRPIVSIFTQIIMID